MGFPTIAAMHYLTLEPRKDVKALPFRRTAVFCHVYREKIFACGSYRLDIIANIRVNRMTHQGRDGVTIYGNARNRKRNRKRKSWKQST